jgi:D-alanyl-D-alanine dipeptidase
MLTPITEKDFHVLLDIRYATADNFTGAPVYARPVCFLHPEAAAALARAVALAATQGLRLRIFDGYRPTEVQQLLWDHTPDPEFLAPPVRGSAHSRGVAVDLTLTDAHGVDLEMGTAFDAFTPLSHHGVLEISAEAQRNRALLLGIMTAAGWDFYRNEWWHYQLFSARSYPLLSDAAAGTHMLLHA